MPPTVFRSLLNTTLDSIAAHLDLDSTRYQNAEVKYKAIGQWLDADNSSLADYEPIIYPQGSFVLGTIVKPFSSKEDYDIDIVCRLSGISKSPQDIKYLVGERLQEHEGYRKRLEEMNRCWRVNYTGEFHLDILPAIPALTGSETSVRVPDRELQNWQDTDPKGYAAWFRSQMEVHFAMIQKSLAELEQKRIEDIPDFRVKTTLQRAIQLMKRNRDIKFQGNPNVKPISIIITTLAGLSYHNQNDLFDTLISTVEEMPKHIEHFDNVTWVTNPISPHENFADKWQSHPERERVFFDWLDDLGQGLAKIDSYENIEDAEDLLAELFGEQVTTRAIAQVNVKDQISIAPTPKKEAPVISIKDPNKPWGVHGK